MGRVQYVIPPLTKVPPIVMARTLAPAPFALFASGTAKIQLPMADSLQLV